jgi:hypothetical protein
VPEVKRETDRAGREALTGGAILNGILIGFAQPLGMSVNMSRVQTSRSASEPCRRPLTAVAIVMILVPFEL